MSQHDNQGTNSGSGTASGQFSGDDIEFAPFMFDASPEATNASSGQFGNADMEFEPFMFNQGEGLGMQEQRAPGTPDHTSPPRQSMPTDSAPTLPETATPALMAPSHAPFAGSEVPLPSYLQPRASSAPQSMPTMPSSPPWAASPMPAPAGRDALPGWGSDPAPIDPIQQFGRQNTTAPVPSGSRPQTGPLSAPPVQRGGTGPIDAPPSAVQAPTQAPSHATGPITTPGMLSGMGMGGRSRGNTGPLSSTMPNASWSDSSLASIEDFSSVLIAMQAGKRLRQSGPLSGSMPTQASASHAPAMSTATATAASPTQPQVQPSQPAIPDWATQAAAGMADVAPAMQPQPEPEAAPTWASAMWEPQLPGEPAPAWMSPTSAPSPLEAQPSASTTQPASELLPPWSMNPPTQPPDATSWTGAQPQTAPAMDAAPAPATAWPTISPVPVSTPTPMTPDTSLARPASTVSPNFTDSARAELAAIREKPVEDSLGGLEPGVADLFRNMNPAITEGTVSGDDLQFEGFMFNQGMPAPLPGLPSLDPDPQAMSSLPHDMGPVFDPSLYANTADAEETHEYADVEPSDMGSMPGSIDGPLPFWLQNQSATEETQTSALAAPEESAASTPVPTMPGMPDMISDTEQSYSPGTGMHDSAALMGAFGDASASSDEFNDLPPIDPFDFSMLDSEITDEPFGFNTGELSGLMPDEHDPMVVTANLEALADLLGGHVGGGNLPDLRVMRPAGLSNVEMAIPVAHSPAEMPIEPEPTPLMQSAQPGAPETLAPAPEPTLEPANQGGWMGTVTTNLSMDTLSSLTGNLEGAASDADMVVEDLDVSPFDFTELDLAVEEEVPTGYLDPRKSMRGPGTANLEALPEDNPPAHHTQPALEEIWSEADGDSSLFTGDLLTEAPDEDVEMPTGYLREEAYSAPMPMPTPIHDAPFMDAEPVMPFVAPTEAADVEPTTEMPMSDMVEETGTAQAPHVIGMSDFMPTPDGIPEMGGWDAPGAPQTNDLAWMVGMSDTPASQAQEDAPEEPLFRARVSSASWGNYPVMADPVPVMTDPVPEPEPVAQVQPEPSPHDHDESELTEDGVMRPWSAAPTVILDQFESEVTYSPWQDLAASATATTPQEAAQDAGAQVQFEEEYVPTVAARGDITTSGPLPSLDGFEGLNDWIERNPHDMGAHMALASAYNQAGEIDTALRVYRRMLRKPNISENVLRMIEDELDDLKDQSHQYSRYHQVRGDLLVKQGRRREAIEEYNKVG